MKLSDIVPFIIIPIFVNEYIAWRIINAHR